jgi:hypothetical protein
MYGDCFDDRVATPSTISRESIGTPATANRATTTTSEPALSAKPAEIVPFTFKFVVSYADDINNPTTNMSFYNSMSMGKAMPPFWALLSTLSAKWEEQASDRWAWEFQKRSSAGRKSSEDKMPRRFCITSKLANLPTNWRPLDEGFRTCMDCVVAGRPCFTWVMDKNGGDGEGDDSGEVLGVPKGEFWCLPIHQDDRNCPVEEECDIRTWVNEGESIYDGHARFGEETDENGHRAVVECGDEPTIKIKEESSEEYGRRSRHGNENPPAPPQIAILTSSYGHASVGTSMVVPQKKKAAVEVEPVPPLSNKSREARNTPNENVKRKPDNIGQYYNQSVAGDGSAKQRGNLPHVARIEETSDGEDYLPKCRSCEAHGHSCRRYTQTKMAKFSVWRCARCIFDEHPCQGLSF